MIYYYIIYKISQNACSNDLMGVFKEYVWILNMRHMFSRLTDKLWYYKFTIYTLFLLPCFLRMAWMSTSLYATALLSVDLMVSLQLKKKVILRRPVDTTAVYALSCSCDLDKQHWKLHRNYGILQVVLPDQCYKMNTHKNFILFYSQISWIYNPSLNTLYLHMSAFISLNCESHVWSWCFQKIWCVVTFHRGAVHGPTFSETILYYEEARNWIWICSLCGERPGDEKFKCLTQNLTIVWKCSSQWFIPIWSIETERTKDINKDFIAFRY